MSRADLPVLAPLRTGVRGADVAARVAAAHGLSLADLQSRDKSQRISLARQTAMLALARHGFSTAYIARLFRRDWTTVQFGVARAKAREAEQREMGRQAA